MKIMRKLILLVLFAVLTVFLPVMTQAHPHIVDAAEQTEITPEALLEDLRRAQVIFLGEFHDHVGHHRAQLTIIDALDDDERPLAIGLEMFRKDSQETLDRWTANDLPFLKFLSVYNDNWSMWQEYREIFASVLKRFPKRSGGCSAMSSVWSLLLTAITSVRRWVAMAVTASNISTSAKLRCFGTP
jgi:uncharacterized iron-regulated protein